MSRHVEEDFIMPAVVGFRACRSWAGCVTVALILLWAGLSTGHAQYEPFSLLPPAPGYRRQLWEFYGLGQYWHADELSFGTITVRDLDGHLIAAEANLEMDDTVMGGFGLAFNINDHWSLNGEFIFGSSDYRATWADYELRGEMFMSSGRFNVEYNVLAGPFTPFVRGGLGYYYFDTGIPSGPPGWSCWWDSWWGYVCEGYVQTHTETDFALNAGGGFRWDINDWFFLKTFGGATWVDMSGDAGWPMFIEGTFALGIKW
jgi:hypothetical protein